MKAFRRWGVLTLILSVLVGGGLLGGAWGVVVAFGLIVVIDGLVNPRWEEF